MQNDLDKLKVIHAFKAGTFTSSNGRQVTTTVDDLDLMAAVYNDFADRGEASAPLCLGHPLDDQPAYGTTTGLISRNGNLYATVHPSPQLTQWVREGKYKSVSVSFHPPESPVNPSGGRAWFLKHIGFLDNITQRPAVKGLISPAFAEGEPMAVTFRNEREHVYFSEFNAIAPTVEAARHHFICEVSRSCGTSYSEAIHLAQPYLWR